MKFPAKDTVQSIEAAPVRLLLLRCAIWLLQFQIVALVVIPARVKKMAYVTDISWVEAPSAD